MVGEKSLQISLTWQLHAQEFCTWC
jgi:hypothetical protein